MNIFEKFSFCEIQINIPSSAVNDSPASLSTITWLARRDEGRVSRPAQRFTKKKLVAISAYVASRTEHFMCEFHRHGLDLDKVRNKDVLAAYN